MSVEIAKQALRPADEPVQSSTRAAAPLATTSAPPTRPSYETQFSPATQALLTKMKNGCMDSAVAGAQAAGVSGLTTAKYQDARRRLMLSLKTSDTIQLPPANEPRNRKSVFKHYKNSVALMSNGGLKRKRSTLDDVDSPYSDADAESPQPRKPLPRAPVRKRKFRHEGVKRCSRCDRQAFTEENYFITCPKCDEDWHLGCTPPNLLRSWRNDPARFKCFGCVEEVRQNEEYNKVRSDLVRRKKEQDVAKQKQRTLASLPVGVSFEKTDMIGFGAGSFASDSARSDYFTPMSRKDQLSLLSFCDKLRPGLLADLLASVSKKHPDLPIFNSPDWAAQVASRPPPQKTRLSIDGGGPRPRAVLKGHLSNGTSNGSPQPSITGSTCLSKPEISEPFKNGTEDPDVPVDDDDDLLPPNWPKEGEGLYSMLPPEANNAVHLVDADDDMFHSGYKVVVDTEGNVEHRPTSCA